MSYEAEQNNSSFVMVKVDNLEGLWKEVKSLKDDIREVSTTPVNHIYTNKEVKELLGIQDKLLKKYRDDGLLSYSQVGDKYWYRQSDIDKFLESNYYAADM